MGKPKKNFSTELLAAPGGSKGGRRTETDRDAFPGQTHSETVQESRPEQRATPPAIRAVEAFERDAATSPIASSALTATDEDADLDAETAPIESSKAEDSRAEASEEEPDSEWERDAAAAPASTAPRSRKKEKQARRGTSWTASKYVGVFRRKDVVDSDKIYSVKIETGGIREYLGTFSSEVEAAKAYDARARQLGRLSKLNFPTADDPLTYTGVKPIKKNGKFHAQIRENGKAIHLGTFTSSVQAAKAFDKRARQLGRFANLNFPTAEELRSNMTRSRGRPFKPSSASEQPSKRAKRAAETASGSAP